MKEKGIPHLRGKGRGDHKIKVRVLVPTDLNEKQKELLRAFEESLEDDNYHRVGKRSDSKEKEKEKDKNFFDKMKDAFRS